MTAVTRENSESHRGEFDNNSASHSRNETTSVTSKQATPHDNCDRNEASLRKLSKRKRYRSEEDDDKDNGDHPKSAKIGHPLSWLVYEGAKSKAGSLVVHTRPRARPKASGRQP